MRRGHPVLALLAAFAALVCAVALAACGDDDNKSSDGGSADGKVIERNADNASTSITVGSKNFTEQFILGEIYAQALQAAGYNVKKDLNLGSEQIALRALKSGDVDGYPEYTSTALTLVLRRAAAGHPEGRRSRRSPRLRTTSRRRASWPTRPLRSRARTPSGS